MKVGTTMESTVDPIKPAKHLSKWTQLPVELLLLVFSLLPRFPMDERPLVKGYIANFGISLDVFEFFGFG